MQENVICLFLIGYKLNKKELKRKKKRPGRKLGVKVKHGAFSLISRGTLPRKRKYLEGFLSQVRKGLIRDLGPEEQDLTTAQLILIDRVIGKLGILRCMEEYARESGVMKENDLLPPLKKNFLSWANSLRLDLQALGIDKRQTESMNLEQYVEMKDKEKEKGT